MIPRMETDGKNTLVVLGPTASGKTRLGVHLASRLGGEVLSADSRQVYRGLDIGSGKDLGEYVVNGAAVPYHLIDIAGLDAEFSVFDYQRRFFDAFEDVTARERLPVVVGGTGLYLDAVLRGYRLVETPGNPELRVALEDLPHDALMARLKEIKPDLHNTTDLLDRERLVRAIEIAEYARDHAPEPGPEIRPLVLGTLWDRSELRGRIAQRLRERLDGGMIEEVRGLIDGGVPAARLELLGLEYRFIAEFLDGRIRTRNDLFQKLNSAIAQFAKRQETWFRRMERQGVEIRWIPRGDIETAWQAVLEYGYADNIYRAQWKR
ncbi:MAG: tRNA dimethylallyltransferase [Candidatus Hydrogenedentes bacterium]|nr:tRNA dimethylallyltransferase [Candidatus Hydrogenedentota bacterium]